MYCERMPNYALIIVDVQNDFIEGGALAVEGGLKVAEDIAKYVKANSDMYNAIITTQDWHKPVSLNGNHFASEPDYENTWPKHCVEGTTGAALADPILDLDKYITNSFLKGYGIPAYSGFEGASIPSYWNERSFSLLGLLRSKDISVVHVVGLAFDYCVLNTALDAARLRFNTAILKALTASVHPEEDSDNIGLLKIDGVTMYDH